MNHEYFPQSRRPHELQKFRLSNKVDQEGSIAIRIADRDGERSRAKVLLNRAYSRRGYGADHQLPAARSCVTFIATSNDDVLGTLTLTVDSPSALAADRTFSDELAKFRRRGSKLCELTKFAFETSMPARPRLAALFHIIFIYESVHYGSTDLFIEVNPRHRCFYEKLLGFTSVGDLRTNATVGAPSQLMWLNRSKMRGLIDSHASTSSADSRSLYANFFSREEEAAIRLRLRASNDEPILFRGQNSGELGRSLPPRQDSQDRLAA